MNEVFETENPAETPADHQAEYPWHHLESQRLDAMQTLGHLEREDHRQPTPENREAVLEKRAEVEAIIQEELKMMESKLNELEDKERIENRAGNELPVDEKSRLAELRQVIDIAHDRLDRIKRGQ